MKAAMTTASKAVKGFGIAGVVGVGSQVARSALDIEDDGGLADSGLDVLEFAAYGAAIGSVVPGAGTVVGAAVGGAIGLANEAWEFATDPDRESFDDQFGETANDQVALGVVGGVPNDQVINDNPASNGSTVVNNNNIIDVKVNVDKDGVKTEVSNNGEEYMDTESI